MFRNNRFNRLWAAQSDALEWPTDDNAETGFGFLGTYTPTTGLHDALFQANDWKDNWLHDQIATACRNFGGIQLDYEDKGSRNALSDAIEWALINQNQSSPERLGIIRTATTEQAVAGTDNHLAIVPMTLARTLDNRLVWEGIKNRPQTATRWPNWDEVGFKPNFGSAAWQNSDAFDWAGTAKAYYDSLTNDLKALTNRLSGIAWSGELNDGHGVLDKSHGGTGRGDGNYNAQWFYAERPASSGNATGLSGLIFGNSVNNKICDGEDNGEDIGKSGNISLDTWYGVSIRSTINQYQTTWLHNSRNGDTRQRGGLYLDNFVRSTSNTAKLMNNVGDSVEIMDGNKFIIRNSQGYERFHIYDGSLWTPGDISCARGYFYNQLEVHNGGIEISGDVAYIDLHHANSTDDYTARLITTTPNDVKLAGSSLTIERDLWINGRIRGGGLNRAAFAEVFDKQDLQIPDIPYGQAAVPSIGALRICMDNLSPFWGRSVIDPGSYQAIWWGDSIPNMSALYRLKSEIDGRLSDMKGKWTSNAFFNDLVGNENELLTTRQFADFRNHNNEPGGIGSYVAVKQKGTGDRSNSLGTGLQIGWQLNDLGNYADWSRARYPSLGGTWKVMCIFSDCSSAGWDRDIILCKRVR